MVNTADSKSANQGSNPCRPAKNFRGLKMECISFDEMVLIGVYNKFGWSLKTKKVHSGEKTLRLNLHITNDYIVTEEILEEEVLGSLQQGTFNGYIEDWLDLMIERVRCATKHL